MRKAARKCQLSVGSMGLALFDGLRPVATWPYKIVNSALCSQRHFTIYVNTVRQLQARPRRVALRSLRLSVQGRKVKEVVFKATHPIALMTLIQTRLDGCPLNQSPPSGPERKRCAKSSHCASTSRVVQAGGRHG